MRSQVRGFTLLELSVVLGISALLASVGMSAVTSLKQRSARSSALGDLLSGLRLTRAEALGRGIPTAFIIDTVAGRWWGVEAAAPIDLSTFDPASSGPVIASGIFPSITSFGPASGYALPLPSPLAGIPTTDAQSPNYAYCSFCRTSGTNTGFGVIRFETGARSSFSGGPRAIGQQFSVTAGGTGTGVVAVTVVEATGDIQTFEK
ncbi:MAG: pilus assembly FimT family protein [Myxococcaceae bacterium]